MTDKPDGAARVLTAGAALAILTLVVFQTVWALRTRDTLAEMKTSLERLDAIEESIGRMKDDQDILVDDLTRIARKVDDLVASMEGRGAEDTEVAEPPVVDWTQPQLFEAAKRSAAEYGIELSKDEVRVPARFVLRSGPPIEYFAVLKGGKEHETLLSLVGNIPKGERRPKDFAARLNNAVQAIGFKRGKRARNTGSGWVRPEGETAYLFVEWREGDETVLVRAEDLVWNRIEEKPLPRGSWIYVGSSYVRAGDEPAPVFAADITAEVVATYSSLETMFDNSAPASFDDSAYIPTTPHIPADVDDCVLVIRRVDREPTRTFPDMPGMEPDPPEEPDERGPAPGEGTPRVKDDERR